MLTRMTYTGWKIVLEAFRAARSRRGDKGRDDRKFLEALHYFAVHNITWRARPRPDRARLRRPKRFWRLSQRGVFEAMLAILAGMSAACVSTPPAAAPSTPAASSAAGAKGGRTGR